MNAQIWDKRYQTSDIPWENGLPHPEVQRLFSQYVPVSSKILEIGCGLGTNAQWLAQAGHIVTAMDIAPYAIQQALENTKKNNLAIDFTTGDFLKDWQRFGTHAVVFDCAVFQVIKGFDARQDFVKKVSECCMEKGYWINISCSVDEANEITHLTSVKTPPALSARDIVISVEPFFEIVEMKRCNFKIDRGEQGSAIFNAWASIFKKR